MPAYKLGFRGRLYYNSATYNSPTWVLCDIAKDVSIPLEDDDVELDSRLSDFHMSAGGLRKMGIEWSMIYDPTNTSVKGLVGKMWNRTNVDMLALDGAYTVSGNCGWRMVGALSMANKDEKLTEGQLYTFSLKPTWESTQRDPVPVKADGNANIPVWDFS
jgi:hypothetical protein